MNKFKFFSIFAIIFGFFWVFYAVFIISTCPGTFLDNLTSFNNIFAVFGLYHIFAGIFRLKTSRSFISYWKNWFKKLFFIFVSIVVFICIINLSFILSPLTTNESYCADYLILLGGGISKDGKLPESVLNRVEKAGEYLTKHPETVCVVTGGTLKWLPYAEAPEIKNQLIKQGISEEKILVDDKALDTIQNLQNSCKILSDYYQIPQELVLKKSALIVTSSFHLRRAERLAKRLGFSNYSGLKAKIPTYAVPSSYAREICAYIKLNLRILFTKKPEKIA